MEERDLLLGKIERLREELNRLVKEKGELNEKEIIEKSRRLDKLITEYTTKFGPK